MWYSREINDTSNAIGDWIKILSQKDLDSLQTSFQDGVNTLYNKCVSCGVTPSSKTPTAISNAIQSIYNTGKPVVLTATKDATRNNTNFTLDVTIPKNLTYVCAGITGVEGASGYDDSANWKLWSVGTSWTYTASSGVIRFTVSPGGGTYIGANCKITYKIMYLNN